MDYAVRCLNTLGIYLLLAATLLSAWAYWRALQAGEITAGTRRRTKFALASFLTACLLWEAVDIACVIWPELAPSPTVTTKVVTAIVHLHLCLFQVFVAWRVVSAILNPAAHLKFWRVTSRVAAWLHEFAESKAEGEWPEVIRPGRLPELQRDRGTFRE